MRASRVANLKLKMPSPVGLPGLCTNQDLCTGTTHQPEGPLCTCGEALLLLKVAMAAKSPPQGTLTQNHVLQETLTEITTPNLSRVGAVLAVRSFSQRQQEFLRYGGSILFSE